MTQRDGLEALRYAQNPLQCSTWSRAMQGATQCCMLLIGKLYPQSNVASANASADAHCAQLFRVRNFVPQRQQEFVPVPQAWAETGGPTATGAVAAPTCPASLATIFWDLSCTAATNLHLQKAVCCYRAHAPVSCPAHPTFDLLSLLQSALDEDAGGYGDLTSLATCAYLPRSVCCKCLLLNRKVGMLMMRMVRAGCRPRHRQAQHFWRRPMVLLQD